MPLNCTNKPVERCSRCDIRQIYTTFPRFFLSHERAVHLKQIRRATLRAILQHITKQSSGKRANHHLHIQIHSRIAPTFRSRFQPGERQTNTTPPFTAVAGEPGGKETAIGAGNNSRIMIVVDERKPGRTLGHRNVDIRHETRGERQGGPLRP